MRVINSYRVTPRPRRATSSNQKIMHTHAAAAVACFLGLGAVDALSITHSSAAQPMTRTRCSNPCMQHSKGWDGYGKGPFKFYNDFDSFMAPFPDEDREMYPEMFKLPDGVYEVALQRPLGIAFEEVAGGLPQGVCVTECVEGGNAAKSGKIQPGDVLIAVTAVKVFQARWERKLIPCTTLEFDTIMGAIGSNQPQWGAKDVVLQFMRPADADPKKIREHLDFFEIPYDHVFKVG